MRLHNILTLLLVLPIAAPAQTDLPAGAAKDTVETVCANCHELRRITLSGYDRDGWRNVLHMMVNVGAPLPAERFDQVADYLAANFPAKPRPEAVLIPGKVQVEFREWAVPTAGSRPHDPLATHDGALWYTGQMANVLGRLDPTSGKFREYRLPPNSGPHGLVEDHDGEIWYTANFAGYIGRLDPKSGKVAQFPLPDPAAKDPHSAIFDQSGILWFTVQGANRVGRLDPRSGQVTLAAAPQPRSNPYGIVIDSKGAPWFAEFGGNRIGRIDPATMAIKDYVLPNPDSRPRRIAVGPDDDVWYTDYSRGYLGRLDPASGAVTEFASPGGPQSRPYGIAMLDGAVWYSESGVVPNTLVRFDPNSATFQSWAIPSGGGVVRHMMAGVGNRLALACSGVNGVALVDVK
jgi:virginiamycin B lyase